MATPLEALVNVTMEGTNCIGVARRPDGPPGPTAGLYYSSDSGQNWYASNIRLGTIAADGIIRIQMNGPNAIANVNNRVYYSSDFGHTWTQSNLPQSTSVFSMALSGQYALIGSGWGVFGPTPSSTVIWYSSDYGATWLGSSTPLFPTPEPTTPRTLFTVNSVEINGSNAVAFTTNGIFYSTNGGASFSTRSTDSGNDITATSNAGVMTSNYVIASVNGIGFLYSTDYGQTFTLSNLTNTFSSVTNSISMDISGNCIASLLSGPNYDIYYSSNYGASWTISTPGTYSGLANAAALSISNGIAVSIGIYSSDNGQTWANSSPQITSNAGAVSNVGLNVITSNSTNTYYSTDGGATYTIASLIPITTILSGFSIPTKTVGDSSFTITAPTTNSDGAFTYTSSDLSVATIDGTTITIVGAGTSTITASQAATATYTAETITASFQVNASSSLITTILSDFSIPTKTVGDSSFTITAPTTNSDGAFTYTSSDLSVATIDGTTITIVGAGTSTITASQAETATYTAETITASFQVNAPGPDPDPIICFLEGSKILHLNAENQEEYIEIEKLKKGDLIKTVKNDYKKIEDIGYSKIYNNMNDVRSTDKLYKCSKNVYSELTEDLVITGAHSILVSNFKDQEQLEKTQDVLGKIYVTGMFYRLPACVDDRTTIYEIEGLHTIWHFSLENENYYSNYGVYANGLLVESCSKRMMKECGMHLLNF
jgi:uncharacterized protein YjdB